MAPHKQPTSLYNFSHKSTVTHLYNSCVAIQRRHGSYDSVGCIQAVRDLQNVLLASIPGQMWNDLCEQVLVYLLSADKHGTYWCGSFKLNSTCSEARFLAMRKIVYALFAHDKLTHVKLIRGCICEHCYCTSLYDKETSFQFWEKIFKKTHKVTKIEFSCSFNTEGVMRMFDVISKFCQDLENISFPFNLSPEALQSLLKCTKLRRIASNERNTRLMRFNREECKHILESLPELEYLDNANVAACFPDLEGRLSLKLTDLVLGQQSSPPYVTLALQMCPNLKHLDLSPRTKQDCSTILEILADSSINLTSLTLDTSDFPSHDSWQQFFSKKCVYLRNIQFKCCHISFKSLKMIGEYGLNLKHLHLQRWYNCMHIYESPLETDQIDRPTASNMLVDTRSPVFKKLTTLTLDDPLGHCDRSFFKWCLQRATNLETLSLESLVRPMLNLENFRDMFAFERLPELVDVTFFFDSMPNEEMIRCVNDNCPKLQKLDLGGHRFFEAEEYVADLTEYIASNNIDLTIYYYTG